MKDYVRTEDFATGEVRVRWSDDAGPWMRRLFVSRPDNAIVLSIAGPGKGKVSCDIAMPPIANKRIDAKLSAAPAELACHNVYVNGKGGYDGQARVWARGGKVECDG